MSDRGKNPLDIEYVRALAALIEETGLTEIEVEEKGRRIYLGRKPDAAPAAVSTYSAPVSAPAPATAAPATAPSPANGSEAAPAAAQSYNEEDMVKSPMVGTAYLAPEPDAPNFVSEGDQVKAGDTLLIVEAMKVMNPILAPHSGRIVQIMIDNGQPVEFDQPLVLID